MEQRLIDANELFEQAQREDYSSSDDVNTTLFMIGNAQTVNAIVIPDNATNGDMIKAMFPNIEWFANEDNEVFTDHITVNQRFLRLSLEFWNSPYRKE